MASWQKRFPLLLLLLLVCGVRPTLLEWPSLVGLLLPVLALMRLLLKGLAAGKVGSLPTLHRLFRILRLGWRIPGRWRAR